MSKITTWQCGGEWSAHGLRKSKAGLVAWLDSRIQGDVTGYRRLIPWAEVERLGYSRESDLSAKHNYCLEVGDYLYLASDPDRCRTLRRGTIVR